MNKEKKKEIPMYLDMVIGQVTFRVARVLTLRRTLKRLYEICGCRMCQRPVDLHVSPTLG